MEDEDFIKLLKKNLEKKNESQILEERIYQQNIGSNPVNLPVSISSKEKMMKDYLSVLFSDNKYINFINPVKKRRKIDKNKKLKLYNYIPEKTENLLTKVYERINHIKHEEKKLHKINSLSLQKTSKFYFQTNRPNMQKSFGKKQTSNFKRINTNYSYEKNSIDNKILNSRNYEQNMINTNENTKEETAPNGDSIIRKRTIMSAFNKPKKYNISLYNQSKFAKSTVNKKSFKRFDIYENKGEDRLRNLKDVDIEKLYSTHKRNKLNLARMNEIYRIQMNKSLKNYKPENHLKELNKLQLNDIKVRRDMEKVKGKINKKIDDRAQGLYYKKEYLKFKEENERDKKARSLEKKPFPIQIPFNILFRDEENKKEIKVFPHGYKIRAYYDYCASCERIQKSKNKDLLEFGADLLFGHINAKDHELLYKSLDELFNALEIEPIMKYIDKQQNEKINNDKSAFEEKIKEYFPVFTETEKILQQMEDRKIIKTKKFDENIDILEKIHQTKRLLKNFEKEQKLSLDES